MTASVLDELPGVGPTRKKRILDHFGTPEAFLNASLEELEAVAGPPRQGRPRSLRPAAQVGGGHEFRRVVGFEVDPRSVPVASALNIRIARCKRINGVLGWC